MTAASDIAGAKAARYSGVLVGLLALAIFINYVDRGNLATAAPLITKTAAHGRRLKTRKPGKNSLAPPNPIKIVEIK